MPNADSRTLRRDILTGIQIFAIRKTHRIDCEGRKRYEHGESIKG